MSLKNKSGWLLIDKPIGVTSNFVLQKVRKAFGNCKAGFVGTLDPLASGYLPVALGSATKLISFIESDMKTYTFTIRWGFRTNTGDLEGDIIGIKRKYPTKFQIQEKLRNYTGKLKQKTPKYSSVKINGNRAYKLARNNIPFQTKERSIFINTIKLNNVISKDNAVFEPGICSIMNSYHFGCKSISLSRFTKISPDIEFKNESHDQRVFISG